MKRKLKTWVKVTAAAVWLTGLSVAASCSSGNIPAAAYQSAADTASEHTAPDSHNAVPASVTAEKTEAQKAGEDLLVVPKLLKEVVSI